MNKLAIIRERDTPIFIEKFNENKVSEDFLKLCKKAGKLFGKENSIRRQECL